MPLPRYSPAALPSHPQARKQYAALEHCAISICTCCTLASHTATPSKSRTRFRSRVRISVTLQKYPRLIRALTTAPPPLQSFAPIQLSILNHIIRINEVARFQVSLRVNGMRVAKSKWPVFHRATQWFPETMTLGSANDKRGCLKSRRPYLTHCILSFPMSMLLGLSCLAISTAHLVVVSTCAILVG